MRTTSYGEVKELAVVDRLGVWLGSRKVRSVVGDLNGKRIGDFGCGFTARLGMELARRADHVTLVDVSLSEAVKDQSVVTAIEGQLPVAMGKISDASLDVTLCLSVLEHISEDQMMLNELRRVTAPGGVCIINVPNWWGKRLLEFLAFRLGHSPEEMDDHKRYYSVRDLWPKLRQAGFLPHGIKCHRYKLRSNVVAICRVDAL
jgi:2-polyprenyl-6-hydroxyphenyl methylase / 3-demethylubiquinone-9 3-methyltransferase